MPQGCQNIAPSDILDIPMLGRREAVMFRAFWRHGSNAALMIGALVICAYAGLGNAPLSPLVILAGAVLFYLTEYTTHRFLFHAPPSSRGWLLKLQRRLHYDHHVEPGRLDLLFLPLWYVAPQFWMFPL
jgi:hypothetical protein